MTHHHICKPVGYRNYNSPQTGFCQVLWFVLSAHRQYQYMTNKRHLCQYIYEPPTEFKPLDNRVKIAFDADAVLFSDESEARYKKEGMAAFHKYESEHEDDPLGEGPFAKLLIKLSKIQEELPTRIELSPLRIAIVTARNAPSHMRVIKTLRKWGVYVDEAYFLGGLSKDKVLKAFGAHIFFDDQEVHLTESSKVVPSGRVPYAYDSPLKRIPVKETEFKLIKGEKE